MAELTLYLIRHGLAGDRGDYPNDDERPLTKAGKKKTRQVAQRLRDLELQFNLMLTSPLVRAKQTADLLMEAGLADQLQMVDFLGDSSPINAWLAWLAAWQHPDPASLALVGHEPKLSAWAEQLVFGSSSGTISLKKAGVIGLSVPLDADPIGHSTLFWLAPPRLLLS